MAKALGLSRTDRCGVLLLLCKDRFVLSVQPTREQWVAGIPRGSQFCSLARSALRVSLPLTTWYMLKPVDFVVSCWGGTVIASHMRSSTQNTA
jgi:hypothetical protein